MIKFVKIFKSKSLGYWYFPEDSSPGMIEIDEKNGEVTVVVESSLDQELWYPIYGNKAKGFVKELFDSGNMPDKEILIWY